MLFYVNIAKAIVKYLHFHSLSGIIHPRISWLIFINFNEVLLKSSQLCASIENTFKILWKADIFWIFVKNRQESLNWGTDWIVNYCSWIPTKFCQKFWKAIHLDSNAAFFSISFKLKLLLFPSMCSEWYPAVSKLQLVLAKLTLKSYSSFWKSPILCIRPLDCSWIQSHYTFAKSDLEFFADAVYFQSFLSSTSPDTVPDRFSFHLVCITTERWFMDYWPRSFKSMSPKALEVTAGLVAVKRFHAVPKNISCNY